MDFFFKRKMPVFGLIFSQSLAFLVPFGHCFRCFEGGWGGGGGSDNPNLHGTVEENKYIVEPGRDSNPV